MKPERREEWFKKKDALLSQCKDFQSDEDFADALIKILGRLHDKHTDLITQKRLEDSNAMKAEQQKVQKDNDVSSAKDMNHIMVRHSSLYDYTLFPKESICYLQFNQCIDDPQMSFNTFLDEMFGKIKEGKIKTLVVDVQYNNGGNSQLCDQLLEHLCAKRDMKDFSTELRFSDLMAMYNPGIVKVKKNWEQAGRKNELYKHPGQKILEDYQQPELFNGKVVFVMGKKTYSSAGILITLARDNHIGTIIGTTSTFPPSHYGEVLPYRLPNTGVLGSISCKFFARPDKNSVDDINLVPDVEINLDNKDKVWNYIIDNFK